MRTEHTMIRATLAALAALATLALAAAPARAQGNSPGHSHRSDHTGHHNTGSWGMRSVNEMFAHNGNDDVVFRTPRIGCSLRGAEAAYRDSVATQPQTPAQRRVLDLLAINPGTPSPDAVVAALARGAGPDSPLGMAARRLATALTGLIQARAGCSEDRGEYPEAPQWQEAIDAFQDYVRNAPDSALSPPAPELLAIHQALLSVINRTLDHPAPR
jgi:hypothetical protein